MTAPIEIEIWHADPDRLRSAVRASLELAGSLSLRRIAMPRSASGAASSGWPRPRH